MGNATDERRRVVVVWSREHVADVDLSRLASKFADIAPDDVRIVRACRSCGSDQHGKPHVVVPPGRTPIHVSLSRSGDVTVVAVTDVGPVGIDVEATTDDTDLRAWVRTESLVKATGHGLTIDPADIVEPRWTTAVDAPDGYVAAVTILTPGPPPVIANRAAREG